MGEIEVGDKGESKREGVRERSKREGVIERGSERGGKREE